MVPFISSCCISFYNEPIKVTVDNFTREYRFNFYDVLANGVNLYEKYTKR